MYYNSQSMVFLPSYHAHIQFCPTACSYRQTVIKIEIVVAMSSNRHPSCYRYKSHGISS